ncbi:MAG: hypothetical protein H6828_04105 [Planctomycetes bacterium]|nr:hypothetical protein [Planctomycetota bacterium]
MKTPALRLVLTLLAPVLGLGAPALARQGDEFGPRPAPVDQFHPQGSVEVAPAYGGRVIVHLSSMPENLNRVIENSAVTNWMLYELSERLVMQDWETWDLTPRLCTHWDTEDQLVLSDAAASRYPAAKRIGPEGKQRAVLYGAIEDAGDAWTVEARSKDNPAGGTLTVPKADATAVERGTVFTFYLKPDVKWHDGHVFDADDVYFTWSLFTNPHVECDDSRFQFEKVLAGEVLDPLTVRFFYETQYFKALETVGDMSILPRHLYDLNDPDNLQYDPETHARFTREHPAVNGQPYVFTDEDLAEYVNKNPHNTTEFIGLGPYKLREYTSQYIEVTRFADYNPAISPRVGYVDTIRWRCIPNDNSAMEALMNGELDFFARVTSEDYFGEATEKAQFTDQFYKGYYFDGTYGYTGWNTYRPHLSDPNVRKALAMAFNVEEYRQTQYKGLAYQVTGPQNYFGPGYDHSVQPLPYDPDTAEEFLIEAGWYDRDGDGIIDKDGRPFVIDFVMPNGNKASRTFGLKYQEALGRLGIKLEMREFEWATFLDKMHKRDFDCLNLAWVPPLESDPEQLWHSKWAGKDAEGNWIESSNNSGLHDPEIDAMIEAIQVELDAAKRADLLKAFHRRIYDLQPYFFMFNSPRKFAMNKKVRGFQSFKIAPGYSIRRWYYPAGTAGTRAAAK